MRKRPGKRIEIRAACIFLFLISFLSSGCTHTGNGDKALEDYLEPPQIAGRTTARIFEMSRNFLNSLYERREYHLKFISQDDGGDKSHSLMCAKKIEESIKSFNWPEKYKDLQHERQVIAKYLYKQLGCSSVVRPEYIEQ